MPKKGPDKRIHVTFDDGTREILEIISEKEKRPMSEVVRRMVEDWMERYEDQYWCDIAVQESSSETVPIEQVWKHV